jgi:hypothetical protein
VDGKVEVPFWPKGRVPRNRNTRHDGDTIGTPFIEEQKRRKLRDLLNEIPGIDLKPGNPNGLRSTFDLFRLDDKETFDKLVEVFDWCVNETVTGTVRLPGEAIEAKVESDLDSLQAEEEYFEGQRKQRFTNYYERDQKVRAAAVNQHGVTCKVCDFNFEETQGFLLPMEHLLKLFPETDTGIYWRMSEQYIKRYLDDPMIKIFELRTKTVRWW